MSKSNPLILLLFLLLVSCGNSDSSGESSDAAERPPAESTEEPLAGQVPGSFNADPGVNRQSLEQLEQDLGIPSLAEAWTGDFDGMVERRVIRVLTVYGVGRYYLDGITENGIVYEVFKQFEESVNKRQKTGKIRIHVLFIPVARDELIPALIAGRGDIVAAGLTITPERGERVDFTDPTTRELSEILVTGPSAPPLTAIEDLAGQTVSVRRSSSYYASLQELNRRFAEEGRKAVKIEDVSPFLEDEDLLEMVNAGLLEWAVVDNYKARIWSQVFDRIEPREDIVFRSGARLGWAVRKNSPKFLAELNTFLKSHRQGTLMGNVLINRHVRDYDWAGNALEASDFDRFQKVIDLFKKYGDQYSFDFLIVAAQGYQESRLDQNARSKAGAVGIMQLLPSTAADPNVGIPDITRAEPNIHAGIKYLDFLRMRYFNDPDITLLNQTLFALAAYNAGPVRISKLRSRAAQTGYDPNKWFGNVEVVVAREVGSEPVKYVANILKYYVSYRLSLIREAQRAEAREKMGMEASPSRN